MREIQVVLDTLKSLSTNKEFHKDMDMIKEQSAYIAPEHMGECWKNIHHSLEILYRDPMKNEESLSLYSELSGMPKEEIIERESKR